MNELDSLKETRHCLAKRLAEIELLLSEWDRKDICDCARTPNAPRCLLLTEKDLINRHLDCIDRQVYSQGTS